ncbi:MAG: hypothetical protein AAF358_11610 [Pseudomonadota bacterium]
MRNHFLAALFAALSFSAATAGTVTAVDTDFSTLPSNIDLVEFSSDAATSSLTVDDVAGSLGLVFRGTWTLAPGGAETALGIYRPLLADTSELDFSPADNDGIAAIDFSLEAGLPGTAGDNVTRLFAQLIIYQQLENGAVRAYTQFRQAIVLTPGPIQAFSVTNLIADDFDDGSGGRPDFSPTARPMAFGLQLGGRLSTPNNAPGDYLGGVSADNWAVTVDTGLTIFADGFE